MAGLWVYVAAVKQDAMARNLGLFGFVFGGIGFSAGQSIQAWHSWNAVSFREGWFASIEPYMNWWNTMETTFGAIMGAGLGLGVWLNRRRLPLEFEDRVELPPRAEAVLLAGHAALVAAWNFVSFDALDRLADQSLAMGLLPLALVVGGRYSPYFVALPIVALPMCGKTVRELCYYTDEIPRWEGWVWLLAVPMAVMLAAAYVLARGGLRGDSGQQFARRALLLASWTYYALNFAFFRFPWPWQAPTARTPSAVVFFFCLVILTIASLAPPAGNREYDSRS
jgi:hypothetical protein